MKYVLTFIWDIFTFIIAIFDKVKEYRRYKLLDDGFIHNRMDYEYKNRFRLEWGKVLSSIPITLNDLKKVYSIQSTTYVPPVTKTMEYYIKHRFWSALNFHEIDTFDWSDEEFYNGILMNKGLEIYYVITTKEPIILLATLEQGKLEYIKHYNDIKVPLYKIRRRQVVYEEEKGVCIV